MAKRKSQAPHHVRIARWIWDGCTQACRDGEQVVDVAFRDRATKVGPAGWAVLFVKTVLGKEYAHGIFFPHIGRPKHKDMVKAIEHVRGLIDDAQSKSSLIVTPQEANAVLTKKIPAQVKLGPGGKIDVR